MQPLDSLVVLACLALSPQGPPPTSVRTDAVREVPLQDRRQVNGDVRAARRAHVASEEAGRVLALAVEEGARVAAGDLLASLESRRLELELGVLEGEEVVARALFTEREREVERERRDADVVRSLVERDAANPKELADAETAVALAEARLAQAQGQLVVLEARVALLRERIADTEIRAPFAGIVAAVSTELGQWVAEGEAVVELHSDELEVWLELPQRHLAALDRGATQALAVRLGGAATSVATSTWRLVPVVDPGARMLTVIADLPATGAAAPGMSATAWMPLSGEAVRTTVAVDGLLRNELGPYLFVAVPGAEGEPWSARPVQVEVLWRLADRAVVSGALRAGDQVVVEGKERLYPGAPVLPAGAGADERGER